MAYPGDKRQSVQSWQSGYYSNYSQDGGDGPPPGYDGQNPDANDDHKHEDSFLTMSPIHGFSFIGHTKSKKYIYFWLILMAIFFVIMIANFTQLIYQYATQEPVTMVAMNVNQTMEMPPVTICVVKFDKNDLIWNLYDPTNDRYPGTPLDEQLTGLLNSSNKESFLAKWDDNHYIVQAAYYYFKMMSKWEHSISDDFIDIKTERAKAQKDNDQWRAAEKLEAFAIKNGISRQELFVKLGEELNKVYQLDIQVQRFVDNEFKEEKVTYPKGHPLSWVGEGELCFLIQLPYKIGDPSDKLEITLNPKESGDHRSTKPKNPIRISMNKKTKLRSVDDAQINTYTSYLYAVSAELASVFETTEKCSTTKAQRWCQAECRQKLIVENCGCRPFDYDIEYQKKYSEKLTGSETECWATKHFDSCKPYKGTADRKCITKDCQPDCTVESQQIILKGSEMIKKGFFFVDYIKFRLSVGNFIYPSFKQATVMQWQNFIADFGGLFGLYFGASFLSIVHVGEYLFRKVHKAHRNRKRQSTTVDVRKMTGMGPDDPIPTPH